MINISCEEVPRRAGDSQAAGLVSREVSILWTRCRAQSAREEVNDVYTAISEEKLREDLDRIIREVTEVSTGVALIHGEAEPGDHVCTVHIGFRQGFHSSLSLRADAALFIRLARSMLMEERITAQDLEDVAKEYFNVLCGHIAAALYKATHISARLSVPFFYWGSYSPKDHREQFVIRYASGQNEAAELVYHVPIPREEERDSESESD